jgi:hypothetical protein
MTDLNLLKVQDLDETKFDPRIGLSP